MPHRVLIEVLNRLAFLGEVSERRMFGGHGLYLDGDFFGLIDGENSQLYLRTDATMAAEREAAGSWLFAPMEGKGTMNYAAASPAVLDEPARLAAWCERALRIARLKKESETCSLLEMRNIAKDSAFFLLDAGITSPAKLRKLGAIAAFRAVRQLGHEPPMKLLWVVDGALSDTAWHRLGEERKAELEAELNG
jgi:DNA transformation protein and related proteins